MQFVSRKIYLPAALLLASVSTGFALVSVRTNSGGPPSKLNEGDVAVPVTATAVNASTTSNPNPQQTEAVVLTVFRTGFDPAQATFPAAITSSRSITGAEFGRLPGSFIVRLESGCMRCGRRVTN